MKPVLLSLEAACLEVTFFPVMLEMEPKASCMHWVLLLSHTQPCLRLVKLRAGAVAQLLRVCSAFGDLSLVPNTHVKHSIQLQEL